MVIDLTDCTGISDLSDLRYRISGKNLIITVPEDDEYNKGTITLKNYTRNLLKSLSFNLYEQDTITYNNLSEFTNDIVFSYDESNLDKKNILTGSAYNDKIDISNETTKKYTINAGNGENDITISGGKNVINSGKNDDIINVSDKGNYTINAGAGVNTINIDNSYEFGTVIISEQKLNATNNIVLSEDFINPEYKRVKNDMYIVDENGTIILKNYYAKVKNKSTINISINDEEKTLSDYLSEKTTEITGSGTINGTDGNDIVTITGKGATTINTGKGDDIIGYAKGNRTMYFSEGDGKDIIEAGDGTDTLRFASKTEVSAEFLYNTDGISQLVVHYGTKGDTVTFTEYSSKSKIYYYVGNKKYSMKTLLTQGDTITNNRNISGYIYGGKGNDTITNKKNGTVSESICGGTGDDTITNYGTVDWNVYGDDGDDTITNNGTVTGAIFGFGDTGYIDSGTDDDTITNNGTVSGSIFGDAGNDTITNNGTVSGYISGGAGDDIITNNGNVSGDISGGVGDDIIANNGSVGWYIWGGTGNDTITTGKNSSTGYILFNKGDGHDTLYLNASNNVLKFNEITDLTYSWSEDEKDLVLRYNDNSDSVTLKNFDTDNKTIYLDYDNNKRILLSDIIKYGFNAFDTTNGHMYYSNESDVITIKDTTNFSIDCNDENDIITNNGTVTGSISGGAGNDTIINETNGVVYSINGDADNDIITNNGTVLGFISDEAGNNTITNEENGTVKYWISGGTGDDTITNNGTVSSYISGSAGNDTIINNGTVSGSISGGKGNDIIITGKNSFTKHISFSKGDGHDTLYLNASNNNLSFAYGINDKTYSWSGDDLVIKYNNERDSITIKNYNPLGDSIVKIGTDYFDYEDLSTLAPDKNIYGTNGNDNISSNIYETNIFGRKGNDNITNEENGTAKSIYGDTGDDTITNNGKVSSIDGGDDNDTITNNGNVSGYISGGAGNDIIITGENSSTGRIIFCVGDGHDTLYLNASTNNLMFAFGGLTYSWSGDDLVIKYNNERDSVTIKNYNPLGNSTVKIGTLHSDYVDLSTLIPEKINTLSDDTINQLRSDVAGWVSDNGFEGSQQVLNSNDKINISNLIAENQNTDWQQSL